MGQILNWHDFNFLYFEVMLSLMLKDEAGAIAHFKDPQIH